jgi:hypothetical protein
MDILHWQLKFVRFYSTTIMNTRMKQRTVKHKNITRVDHPSSHSFGYLVRVSWRGERRGKFFSDKVHGDRLGALAAAIDWRNATEKELGKPRTERQVVGIVYSSSGIPGVRRVLDRGNECYEATWVTTAGKLRRTKYSIAKHGEKRALELARKARQRGERARWTTPASADD